MVSISDNWKFCISFIHRGIFWTSLNNSFNSLDTFCNVRIKRASNINQKAYFDCINQKLFMIFITFEVMVSSIRWVTVPSFVFAICYLLISVVIHKHTSKITKLQFLFSRRSFKLMNWPINCTQDHVIFFISIWLINFLRVSSTFTQSLLITIRVSRTLN